MSRCTSTFERPFLCGLLALCTAGCAGTRATIALGPDRVELVDLSAEERSVLEQSFTALLAIEAAPIQIDARSYAQGSAFSTLFGFEASGAAIGRWWCARIRRLSKGDAWTVAVFDGQHGIVLRTDFFQLPLVDRLAVLIHEARHADGGGHRHDDCPPGFGLTDQPACDARPLGAYSFQAAFLFELYARGQLDPARAQRLYLQARKRILAAYPAAAAEER